MALTWLWQRRAMMKVLRKIAFRDGLGRPARDGSLTPRRKRSGKERTSTPCRSRASSFPGYDVRALNSHGLGYATAYTGGDHCRSYAFQEVFGHPRPLASATVLPQKARASLRYGTRMSGHPPWTARPCAVFSSIWLSPRPACQNTASLMEAVTGCPSRLKMC